MTPIQTIQHKAIFIKNYIPYDFTDTMGQFALEVNYTNGDKDMFTTPMPIERGYDPGDFKSVSEFKEAVAWLKVNV